MIFISNFKRLSGVSFPPAPSEMPTPLGAAVTLILTPCNHRNRLHPAENIVNSIKIVANANSSATINYDVHALLIDHTFVNGGVGEYISTSCLMAAPLAMTGTINYYTSVKRQIMCQKWGRRSFAF